MAGRGPPPKPLERRQRGERGGMSLVPASRSTARPKLPTGKQARAVLLCTLEEWDAFWESEAPKSLRRQHWPAVVRLFLLYDERERSYRAIRKVGRVVTGSQGQPVTNPLCKYMGQCDAEIRQLEDRIGLSPRAGGALNQGGGAAQKDLDGLNDAAEEGDEGEDEDPRLKVRA